MSPRNETTCVNRLLAVRSDRLQPVELPPPDGVSIAIRRDENGAVFAALEFEPGYTPRSVDQAVGEFLVRLRYCAFEKEIAKAKLRGKYDQEPDWDAA